MLNVSTIKTTIEIEHFNLDKLSRLGCLEDGSIGIIVRRTDIYIHFNSLDPAKEYESYYSKAMKDIIIQINRKNPTFKRGVVQMRHFSFSDSKHSPSPIQ
jgi:hypothetical protein